jgi:hypothetical protein
LTDGSILEAIRGFADLRSDDLRAYRKVIPKAKFFIILVSFLLAYRWLERFLREKLAGKRVNILSQFIIFILKKNVKIS